MDSLFTFFNKFNLPSCLKSKMPEIHLGTHTIKSHGVMLARLHMLDWFILLFLGAVEVILYMIHPFHRFVGIYMIEDLKYPLKDSIVPFWVVPLIAVLLPMVIFLSYYFYRRNVYDLHHATLGLLFSILITGVITDAIKDGIGSPRPDFYWRCFPDGIPKFDPITGNVICNGKRSVIDEGHKSFPSGHTSWSFAGLSFLALYLSGKIRLFDHGGHVAKLCVSFLPLLIAAFVGISQVDDYQHHWRDVFAGGILGTTIATFCYLQFFPAPYDMDGWGPYAYFQMLADSRTSLRQSATASGLTVRPTASMRAYHRAERDEEMGEIIAADSSRSTVDAS